MTSTAPSTREVPMPADLAEARAAMLGSEGAVLIQGGATKLSWAAPPTRVDTAIDTRRLDDILDYDPADATVTVQAGITLAALQDELAAHDQRLAIDPPLTQAGATIGGILASDDAGPSRLRHGTMRDLVIGSTVVLADGSIGRSGGNVIKNVAGFDLSKLLVGSLGTLGLIAEVVLRVHPRPAASATVALPDLDAATANALSLAILAAPLEPAAVDWADATLWVRFEGHPDAITEQCLAVRTLAAEHGTRSDRLEGEDERRTWDRITAGLAGHEQETVVRAATLPSHLPAVAIGLDAAAAAADVDAAMQSHTALGIHTARLSGPVERHGPAVAAWRTAVAGLGGHVTVRRAAPGADVDVWGPPPSAIGVMRRVKARFDPDRRLAPGRLPGGI